MIKCECNCEKDKCGISCTCVDSSQVRYKENGVWKTTNMKYKNREQFKEFVKKYGILGIDEDYYLVKG